MRLANELRREHDVGVACPDERPARRRGRRRAHPAPGAPGGGCEHAPAPRGRPPGGWRSSSSGGLALARAASRFRAGRDPREHAAGGADGLRSRVRAGAPPVRAAHPRPARAEHRGPPIGAVVLKSVSEVIAVSDFTAARFDEVLDRPVARRVYNSIDHGGFDPRVGAAGGPARAARHRADAPPARPRRPDHPLEGPGHVDQGARAAARPRARRPPDDRGGTDRVRRQGRAL